MKVSIKTGENCVKKFKFVVVKKVFQDFPNTFLADSSASNLNLSEETTMWVVSDKP